MATDAVMLQDQLRGESRGPLSAIVAVALAALAAASPALETRQTKCVKLTQSQAESRLKDNDITWSSSGNCKDKSKSNCTSLQDICSHTISGVIALKNGVGRSLTITGGTETGHASGTYSHGTGYKVDLRKFKELNDYIMNNFEEISKRGSYRRWESPSGNEFVDEGTHWDITFFY
ncbi:hypothetical protein CC1G_13099 [Coprinopsis cinerea okayama7|uniref:Uncharacterized protein n=1 Tax=Coprinopsis cinerea (strain Okayama-7 / 130 / ATCC MYA-4618 / FGSC 9003) TaxID=240176 RepID=A8P1U9_COPC7|nr:hypothetical protein CC1G_13099 [Coprinopsis cinerea okayama7\|eukprot:XP_001838181.2 hypothetical protein CC1G_13099 [Coprinopsis cinerea okayama7\